MRNISKRGEGTYHLKRANDRPPATADEAGNRWRGFKNRKAVLKGVLKSEQYGLCAYSEVCPDGAGLGSHIEHVVPKSCSPELTFDYHNLVMSALDENDLSRLKRSDYFGGHAKQSQYDAEKFISCLQVDCARFFAYLSDGRIVPQQKLSESDRTKAKATIKILNLDCTYLRILRRNWIEELEDLIDAHLEQGMSLPDLMRVYLDDTNGKLYPFYSASRQRFNS